MIAYGGLSSSLLPFSMLIFSCSYHTRTTTRHDTTLFIYGTRGTSGMACHFISAYCMDMAHNVVFFGYITTHMMRNVVYLNEII